MQPEVRVAVLGAFAVILLALAGACGPAPHSQPPPRAVGPLDATRFNQLALRLNLPVFWAADADGDGAPDPAEIRGLLFYPTSGTEWTQEGAFTPAFETALAQIRTEHGALAFGDETRAAVVAELDQTELALVETDLGDASEADRDFVRRMIAVAARIDRIYARQLGVDAIQPQVDLHDSALASRFRLNWGVFCWLSDSSGHLSCADVAPSARQFFDAYPADMQDQRGAFCGALRARPDAATLLGAFTVLRDDGGVLHAVADSQAYAELLQPTVADLRAAAATLTNAADASLQEYLQIVADALQTDDWRNANAAWSRMSAGNSRWYVSITAEMTRWEPCASKAAYGMTFGRIDPQSLALQEQLSPVLADMERAISELAPGEYAPRAVSFAAPDLVHVVFNAGDARRPYRMAGGTSGGGRTVVLNNTLTDAQTHDQRLARSLMDSRSMALCGASQRSETMNSVFHELAHNLGPPVDHLRVPRPSPPPAADANHELRSLGRTAALGRFAPEFASFLGELTAQVGGLFLVGWLRERGLVAPEEAESMYCAAVVSDLRAIAYGMRTRGGGPRRRSQVAAIRLGALLEAGGLTWADGATSADDEHRGAFSIDVDRFAAASVELMRQTVHIVAAGDVEASNALVARYVDGNADARSAIEQRYARAPFPSLVYSVSW